MREVLTISLNGNAYQIEQGGYEVLRAYLETAQAKLSADPDKAEILADLEQAIAEKCDRYLTAHKNVVSAEEMQRVLTEMGPVVAEPAEASAAGAQNASAAGTPPGGGAAPGAAADKRLYQIHEGAMLSGVCMGLAAYFGVDVTIVRLIFVGLTVLSGGLWMLAYLAMTLVIPYASTSEERAAAYGKPFNAANLIDAFRRQQKSPEAPQWRHWQRQAKKNARAWRREWRRGQRQMRDSMRGWGPPPTLPQAGYAAPLMIGVLMPIAALFQIVLVFAFIIAIWQLVTTHQILGWEPPRDIPVWADIVILALVLNLVTEPLRAMRRSYYYYGAGANPLVALWATLLWVGFTVVCFSLAFHHWPEVLQFFDRLDEALRHHSTPPADQALSGWAYWQRHACATFPAHIAAICAGDPA